MIVPSAIELELFRNLFVSVTEEMDVVLKKTVSSPHIKKRRDNSCAVYDASGETAVISDHSGGGWGPAQGILK